MMMSPLRWLLAIALAAAVTHAARLDQSMASTGHGKSADDLIPYPECVKTCGTCICTRVWPPEQSMCFCDKKPAAEEAKELSAGQAGERIPQPECKAKCDRCEVCTLVWPPERSTCLCIQNEKPKKPAAVGKRIWGEGFIPYPECIEKCDECTTCTRIYPIELAYCLCVNHDDDSASPKKQALQKSADVAGGDDKQMVMWTKAKTESVSYKECIKTCKGQCACTLIWPPELATCICLAPKPQAAGGKALSM